MSGTAASSPSTMFVGCYAPADEPGIFAFAFEPTLRPLASFAGVANPSWLTVDPAGTHLYATSEVGRGDSGEHGSVHAFGIDDSGATIDLVPLGHRTSAGDHPCHLSLDPTGRWMAAANYSTGNITVLPVLADGGLGEPTATAQHHGSGPITSRQAGPHAHASQFSPDGRWLAVTDLGIDRIVIHAFDRTDGTLTPHAQIPTAPGAGPRLLAFHDTKAFVVNELDNTLTTYDWLDGSANPVQTVSTVPAGAAENTAAGLTLSPDATRVYVTNRGENTVAVFSCELDAGLTLLATQPCDGDWPRSCTLAPDGAHLVVANRRSDRVSVLSLIENGSDIGPVVHRAYVPEPSSLVFR